MPDDPVNSAEDAALTHAAIAALHDAQTRITAALAAVTLLSETRSTRLEVPVQQPLNAASAAATHRRNHRSGSPSKIAADPELRDFIIARLTTHTFSQIRADIDASFPPERRTSLSAMSRWWQREGKLLIAHSQDII